MTCSICKETLEISSAKKILRDAGLPTDLKALVQISKTKMAEEGEKLVIICEACSEVLNSP